MEYQRQDKNPDNMYIIDKSGYLTFPFSIRT
jgi:hypothetical protein